jgi:hypothetical protein
MPHSIVEYRGRTLRARDSHILVALHFLVIELESMGTIQSQGLAADLSRVFVGCTPGCLRLPFEDSTLELSDAQVLCAALGRAKNSVFGHGTHVSIEHLAKIWRADEGTEWLKPFPVDSAVQVLAGLSSLWCASEQ